MKNSNKTESIIFRATAELKQQLVEKADSKSESLSNYIVSLLEEHVFRSNLPDPAPTPPALNPVYLSEQVNTDDVSLNKPINLKHLIIGLGAFLIILAIYLRAIMPASLNLYRK